MGGRATGTGPCFVSSQTGNILARSQATPRDYRTHLHRSGTSTPCPLNRFHAERGPRTARKPSASHFGNVFSRRASGTFRDKAFSVFGTIARSRRWATSGLIQWSPGGSPVSRVIYKSGRGFRTMMNLDKSCFPLT